MIKTIFEKKLGVIPIEHKHLVKQTILGNQSLYSALIISSLFINKHIVTEKDQSSVNDLV